MRHIPIWLLITLLTLSANGDVWGKRLETNWNGSEVSESQTQGNQRGYTDHEHLDSIGLIHMNGRVYEAAEVARGIATGEITGQEAVTGAVITAGLNLVGGAAFKTVNKVTPPVVEEQIKDVVDKALRKNTDAQQNLSDKPTRTADAPDGRGGNNDVEVNDNVNGDATKGTKGASGSVTTAKGNTFPGNSTGSSATGGSPRAPMNPQVQEALDNVKNPSRSHGACCEIDAFNKALNAGDSLKGAKMGPVKLNENGRVLGPCSTCREVQKALGVE